MIHDPYKNPFRDGEFSSGVCFKSYMSACYLTWRSVEGKDLGWGAGRGKRRQSRRTPHGLGARDGFAGGHVAFGRGDVGFADGAIDFAGACGGFETVGQQVALQGEAVGPDAF
jgi:hypothetical protein